jgi:hypothetical protein
MKRISKIFFIVSSIYLLFPFLLLISQPRSGHPTGIKRILFQILIYTPLFISIAWLIKYFTKSSTLNSKLLYFIIISSILIGFIFNLDYQRRSGCFIYDESFFSNTKIIISFVSIILLSIATFINNQKISLLLLIFEFLFWTSKVVYYNSSLDLIFPGYFTVICWTLRIALTNQILIIKSNQ